MYEEFNELFILVPAVLGLKGNLEMTLASRLSTVVRVEGGCMCVCVCVCVCVYVCLCVCGCGCVCAVYVLASVHVVVV